MQHPVVTVSESRTYIIITTNNMYKLELPSSLGNHSGVAAMYFMKNLLPGDEILLCVSYETLKIIKEVEDLPLLKFEKAKEVHHLVAQDIILEPPSIEPKSTKKSK